MPLFMLAPLGEDMSTISRHFIVLVSFWDDAYWTDVDRQGKSLDGKGPRMQLAIDSSLDFR